jgi:hypothetical protein
MPAAVSQSLRAAATNERTLRLNSRGGKEKPPPSSQWKRGSWSESFPACIDPRLSSLHNLAVMFRRKHPIQFNLRYEHSLPVLLIRRQHYDVIPACRHPVFSEIEQSSARPVWQLVRPNND